MHRSYGNTALARFWCWSAIVLDFVLVLFILICLMGGNGSGVIALLLLTMLATNSAAAAYAYHEGLLPVPPAYEYDALPETVIPDGGVTGLPPIPMAVKLDGSPYCLHIEGNHLLIAGRTGAGKSSWIWSLVFGLNELRSVGLVRLL